MIRYFAAAALMSVSVSGFSQMAFPPTPTPVVAPAPISPETFDSFIFPTDVMAETSDVVAVHYQGFRRSFTDKCGCASNPMGGIDKEALILERLKANNIPYVAIDGGGSVRDLASNADLQRNDTIFKAYGAMGFKVLNVAFPELGYGVDKLKVAAQTNGFKLISANTVGKDGNLAFEPYAIENIKFPSGKEVRIGFLGVTRPKVRALAPVAPPGATYENLSPTPAATPIQVGGGDFTHTPVEEALAKYIPELREKSDLVVVFYYQTRAEAGKFAREQMAGKPMPDVMVATEFSGSVNASVQVIDDLKLISAGQEGRQAGVMFLKLENDKPVFASSKQVEIVQSIPSVPEIVKIVDEGKAAAKATQTQPTDTKKLTL